MKLAILIVVLMLMSGCATTSRFFGGLGEGLRSAPQATETPIPKPVSCTTNYSPGMAQTYCY